MKRIGRALLERLWSTGGFIFLVSVAVIVGVAAANTLVVSETGRRLTDRLDRQVITQARTTAATLRLTAPARFEDVLEATRVGGRESALIIVDATSDATSVVPSGPEFALDPIPVLPSFRELSTLVGTSFGLTEPISYRAGAVAIDETRILVVAEPTAETDRTIDDLRRILTLAGMVALAAIIAFATFVIVLARRPIDESIAVAEAIGAGNLEARLDHRATTRDTRRLAAALNQMVTDLQHEASVRDASEHRLREFVADASHELRTPLTSIRAYAELLRRHAITDIGLQHRAMERLDAEAHRMSRIVDALCDLALIDRDPDLVRSRIDLRMPAIDAVEDARAAAPDREFSLEMPDIEVPVDVDEDRLRQAVTNLVANARIHGGDGPVVVRVTGGSVATVSVSDSGPGLSAGEARRAFDRFWRGDRSRSRSTGGSGLGLSLVAAVVDAHGGRIDLDSAPGEGATFTIVLPAARAEPSDTAETAETASPP